MHGYSSSETFVILLFIANSFNKYFIQKKSSLFLFNFWIFVEILSQQIHKFIVRYQIYDENV